MSFKTVFLPFAGDWKDCNNQSSSIPSHDQSSFTFKANFVQYFFAHQIFCYNKENKSNFGITIDYDYVTMYGSNTNGT